MVLADVGLNRVLSVESPLTVGTRYRRALHVLALDVPLEAVPVLDLLVADVAPPVAGLELFHLKIAPS